MERQMHPARTFKTLGVTGGQISRTVAWLILCYCEMLGISLACQLPTDTPDLHNPFYYFRTIGLWAIAGCVAFCLISWPQRHNVWADWRSAQRHHDWRRPLLQNLVLFVALLTASLALRLRAHQPYADIASWLPAYAALFVATILSLLRIELPISSLIGIVGRYRSYVALSVAAAVFVRLAALGAEAGWNVLSGPTLTLSGFILSLYEPDYVINPATPSIRVGRFEAVIADTCSGYEGIGLVCAFLTIYLLAFRGHLRFPHALILFPIGIVAIWVLNSVRIAALVSIGAHVSPEVAVRGFHSRAGWIGFLLVAIALMAFSRSQGLLGATPRASRAEMSAHYPETAYLAPFIALMATSIVMAAAAPHDMPFYVLKVAVVGAVLCWYLEYYRQLPWRVSGEAMSAGIVVGAAWVLTNQPDAAAPSLVDWLRSLPEWVAVGWLAARAIGTIVIVPLAEELAFRGFLCRRIIARDFESVPYAQLTLIALIVNSALFGLMHDRWLAAFLAGLVFTLVARRSQRLSDAIVAHAVANALIFGCAVAFGEWSLL